MNIPDTEYIAEYPSLIGTQLFSLYCPIDVAFAEHELSLESYVLGVVVES
jgi:hypothetical protein